MYKDHNNRRLYDFKQSKRGGLVLCVQGPLHLTVNGAKERAGIACARTVTLDCGQSKGEDWCSVCKDHNTRL